MNWETAKNWLIGLFVLLDILLGWQLYSSRQVMNGYVESQTDILANTKTLLAEHGLTLATDVPLKQPDSSSFQADIQSPSLKQLVKNIFPDAKNVHISTSMDEADTDTGQIISVTTGTWQVSFNVSQQITGTHAAENYFYQGEKYVLDPVESSDGHAVYVQSYTGYPIFDAPVYVTTDKGGLLSYSQTEIFNIRPTSDPKPVISALDALDSLANAVDKSDDSKDNKILKVDLGYARKISLYQVDNQENYWFPVWRVVTQGQIYYINAFTGEVEFAP